MSIKAEFIQRLRSSCTDNKFVKLILSRKRVYDSDLEKVVAKSVVIKNSPAYQLVYKHQTKDITKNLKLEEFLLTVDNILEESMKDANLYTITGDHVLKINKKRIWKLFGSKPTITTLPEITHDRKKLYLVEKDRPFLKELGVINASGNLIKEKGDKFRQIQKFIEVITGQFADNDKKSNLNIVDMGSGKAYLTFALYDYMTYTLGQQVTLKGIELRKHLVESCNKIAKKLKFENIDFEVGGIAETVVNNVDMLIALHACDTATDEAIAVGIKNDAKWIICSPCCHKQVRKDMNNTSFLKPILKHGILMERMSELVTDGVRAMILESHGYKTKVFEFISAEHTGKNLIIVAKKEKEVINKRREEILLEIEKIKSTMDVKHFYLQSLLESY